MEPIRERGLSKSVDAAKDTATKSAYDGRVRLGVKAKADHVTGYLQLETASGTDDNYNWGSGSAAGLLEGGYKTPGSFTKYSGLSNLSEYQINVATKTTCPMTGKDLSLKASATYLDLNEETAAAANGGSYLGTDSDIGTELDAIATWSLALAWFTRLRLRICLLATPGTLIQPATAQILMICTSCVIV